MFKRVDLLCYDTSMNTETLQYNAAVLFNQWGLHSWKFIITENLPSRVLGTCSYNDKCIRIRKSYVEHGSMESVLDTLKHEVAHAVAGAAAGHGVVWRKYARLIGCTPRATTSIGNESIELKIEMYKYQLAVQHPCGKVERLKQYGNRRTNMNGRMVRGRKETMNCLVWVSSNQ